MNDELFEPLTMKKLKSVVGGFAQNVGGTATLPEVGITYSKTTGKDDTSGDPNGPNDVD